MKSFSDIHDVSNSVLAKVKCIVFKHVGNIPSVRPYGEYIH